MALAAGGRRVSLEELSLWRKNGLLPPLASYGPKSPVRAYYWYEPDILARAELVYDALRRHGRSETATISLWLHGFEMPLSRVRRAWLHRFKLAASTRIRPAASRLAGPGKTFPELLLSAALHTAISMEYPHDSAVTVLKRAAAALGFSPGTQEAETQLYWQAAMAALLALNASDIISCASDDDMLGAQRHLHVSLKFLVGYCRDESPDKVIDSLGPSLFLFILALLRSGQHSVIEAAMGRMGAALHKQVVASPAVARAQGAVQNAATERQPLRA